MSPEPIGGLTLGVISLGTVLLIGWVIRRLATPRKFSLPQAPGRPNQLNPLHVVIPFALWLASSSMVGLWKHTNFVYLGLMGTQLIWLTASLAMAHLAFRGGIVRGMGLSTRHWAFDAMRALMAYLIVMPPLIGVYILSLNLVPSEYHHVHPLLQKLAELPLRWRLAIVVSAGVLAPVSEEVFFRGLVQSMFRRHGAGPWGAIVTTSLIFGAIHVPNFQDVAPLVVLSLAMGYCYERTGRLLPSILIHAIFNCLMLIEALGVYT
ncbi:MAG: CPBP family intramembrane glutamic endopeptidase [Phycisphaerae bacterium]